MQIEIHRHIHGSSSFNAMRELGEKLIVDLNIGDIDNDLQEKYITTAHEILNDDLENDEVEYCLSHKIWEIACQ